MKEKIKSIAFQLFMKYGLRSVSMDDIAREAGISKKTLYQHIKDKKSLVTNVMENFLEEDEACVLKIVEQADDAITQMFKINQAGLDIMKNIKPTLIYDLQKYYRETWDLVNRHHMEFFLKIIQTNLQVGITNGTYREDLDVNIISRLFVKTMLILVDEALFPNNQYTKSALLKEHLLYHMNGIINPSHSNRIQEISIQLHQTQ